MKKILVLILLGVITILTPLSFKANYYSIDQPVIDLNNYTLNEVFTDTINDLDQYKITSILDTPIYEGLSLRDIFETGNLIRNSSFDNGKTSWNDPYTKLIVVDGVANLLVTEPSQFFGQIIWLNVDDYYVGFEYSHDKPTNIRFHVRMSEIPLTYVINNLLSTSLSMKQESYIFEITTATDYLLRIIDINDSNWTTILSDNFHLIPLSLFTTAPSQLQLDEWLSFYLDPSTIASFDMVGDIQVYKAGTSFYNLTEMINDKVYSTFNLDTFDNLTDGEITDQFGAWQTLGIEDIEVLSLTEFQTFAPALDQEDMLYWFNYYNLILEYDEVQAGILSDLEITILIIALVLFIIGIALAIYFHHKIMFFVTGLLWFVPIVIVPNIFIITFSVIMIIIFGLLAFYNSQGKDFD